MRVFENLEPKAVFHYFEDLCLIPHGSGNVKQISDYCVEFAKAHNLKCRQDESLNVIIWKDATPGYENAETVILQGHMDMVAVKEDDCDLDMEKEGLRPAITEDGAWVYAKQTSLGGDDGIAVAYALAILADDSVPHPALEAVFTVDEEIGLLGAAALDTSGLKGRILMNMDSEDDGIFLISCAGGARVDCRVPAPKTEKAGAVYKLHLDGLQGGHSGAEIHKGRANANLLLGRYLYEIGKRVDISISTVRGGEKDNAIPVFAEAVLVVADADAEKFLSETAALEKVFKDEYSIVDPGLTIRAERLPDASAPVLENQAQRNFLTLMMHLPFGIQRRMEDMPEMVQTSLNMGILGDDGNEISLSYSVRSSVESEKHWLIDRLVDLTELVGGHCVITGDYPGWKYAPESKIRPLMAETYAEITGKPAVLTAIHAGVECGLFVKKIPGLDCISYGPQMRDIHTTRERLNIKSVENNYHLTLKVLEKLK